MPDYILPVTAPTLEQMSSPDAHLEQLPKPIDVSVNTPNADVNWGGQEGHSSDTLDKMATSKNPNAAFDPTFFDWDKSGAEKFAQSNHYKQLGFDPVLGEGKDLKYGKAETAWDETRRGFGGFVNGMCEGFANTIKSYGNTIAALSSGDFGKAFEQEQLEQINKQATDFDNKWHIFDTGTWASINKSVQSAGSLVGSIAELAVETAITQSIVAGTFGAGAGLEGVESARWGQLLAKGLTTPEEIAQATQQGIRAADYINDASSIGRTWAKIGQGASELGRYTPGVGNLLSFSGDLLAYGAEGGTAATIGRGIGAFTSDIRGINFAVSAASGNAAGTYQQLLANQVQTYKKNNGGEDPGFADTAEMKDKALQAAKTDGALNAWGMLFLEKASFGNLLNNRNTLSNIVKSSSRDVFDRVGIKIGKLAEGEVPAYIKQQTKWYDFKANYLQNGGSELLKSAGEHGVAFGLGSNLMSGIDKGIESYYTAKFDNKDVSAYDAIKDGINSQFTVDGAKTFVSSFLQGALMMGLGGAALKGLVNKAGGLGLNLYDKATGNESDRAAQNADKDKRAKEFVDEVNTIWKDPLNEVKGTLHDMALQDALSQGMQSNLAKGDKKAFHDNADDASREFLMKMVRNSLADAWINRIKEYTKDLSQEDLCKMMDLPNTPENFQSVKGQIENLPGRINDIKRITREVEGKFGSPFNPFAKDPTTGKRLFEDGSDAFKIESNNANIQRIAKDYLVTLRDNAERGGVRRGEILNGKNGSTGIVDMPFSKDMGFSNINTILSSENLNKQIANYDQLLSIDPNDQGAKKGKRVTEEYNKALTDFYKEYTAILDKGAYPEREKDIDDLLLFHKDELVRKLHPFIEETMVTRGLDGKVVDFKPVPERNAIADGVNKLMDYYRLDIEEGRMDKLLSAILDPKVFRRYQMSFYEITARKQREANVPEQEKEEEKAQPETQKANTTTTETTTSPEKTTVSPDVAQTNTLTNTITNVPTDIPDNTVVPEKQNVDNTNVDTKGTTDNETSTTTSQTEFSKEKVKEDILNYYTQPSGSGEVIEEDDYIPDEQSAPEHTDLAKQYLNSPEGTGLKGQLDYYHGVYGDKEDVNHEYLKSVLNKWFDQGIEPLKYPDLHKSPEVVAKDGKYFIGKNEYGSLLEANKALSELHPVIKVGDKLMQVGQYLWNDKGARYVLTGKNEITKTPVRGKSAKPESVTPDEILALSTTNPVLPKNEIPKQRLSSPEEQTALFIPNFHLVNGKRVYYTAVEKAQLKKALNTELQKVTTNNFADHFAIKVTPNIEYNEKNSTYKLNFSKVPGEENPYIILNNSPINIGLYRIGKDEPVAYFTSPGKVTWNIPRKGIQNFPESAEDFELGFKSAEGQSLQDTYNNWMIEYNKSQKLAQIIEKNSEEVAKYIIPHIGNGKPTYLNGSEESLRPTIADTIGTGKKLLAVVEWRSGETVYGKVPEDTQMFSDNASVTGGYHSLFQLPNGKTYWVETETPSFTEGSLDKIMTDVNTASKYIVDNPQEDHKELADNINKQLKTIFFPQNPNNSIVVNFPTMWISPVDGHIRVGILVKDKNGNKIQVQNKDGGLTDKYPPLRLHSGWENNKIANKPLEINGEQFIGKIQHELSNWLKKNNLPDVKLGEIKSSFVRENNGKLSEETVMSSKISTTTDLVKDMKLTYDLKDDVPDIILNPKEVSIPVDITPVNIGDEIPNTLVSPKPEEIMNSMGFNFSASKIIPIDFDTSFEDALGFENEGEGVYKVSTPGDAWDVVHINNFIDEVKRIAPDDVVSVENLGHLNTHLLEGNIAVGRVVDALNSLGQVTGGKIQTFENAPYKFHELGHSIFRYLLSPEKQRELLDEAERKNPATKEALESLQGTHSSYKGKTEQESKDKYQEEWIMDQFDNWKKNRKTPLPKGIKSFFEWLWNLAKEFYHKFTGSKIESFFYKMDRGGFKKAKLQDNEFTTSPNTEALKLIEIGTQTYKSEDGHTVITAKYLSPQDSNQLVAQVARLYHLEANGTAHNKSELLKSILDRMEQTYQPKQDVYKNQYNNIQRANRDDYNRKVDAEIAKYTQLNGKAPESDELQTIKNSVVPSTSAQAWIERLKDRSKAVTIGRESLIEAVNQQLKTLGYRQFLDDEALTKLEEKVGGAAWEDTADMKGGYNNIQFGIRAYLGTIAIPEKDEFGNEWPGFRVLDGQKVYNGLSQLLKNSVDYDDMVKRLQSSINMGDTGYAIRQLMQDVGFAYDKNSGWTVSKNITLWSQLLNSFNLFSIDHQTVEKGTAGTSRRYSANREDGDKTQLDQWNRAFQSGYQNLYDNSSSKVKFRKSRLLGLNELEAQLREPDTFENPSEFDKKAQEISNDLKNQLFISLHPELIKYSIAASTGVDRPDYMNELLDSRKDVSFISPEDISAIKSNLLAGENPFDEEKGALSKLRNLASANMEYDENVESTSYTDAENNMRFSLQEPNYLLIRNQELNDPQFIEKLRGLPDYNNFLLSNDKWLKWNKKIGTVDGLSLKTHFTDDKGELTTPAYLEVNKSSGEIYKSMNKRSVNTWQLISYLNPVKDNGEYGYWSVQEVMSDKNNLYCHSVPVIKSVYLDPSTKEVKITDEAMNMLYSIYSDEINRIKQAKTEIETLPESEKVVDYHTGNIEKAKQMRGLKLKRVKDLMGDDGEKLEKILQNGEELPKEFKRPAIEKRIREYWKNEVDKYIQDELIGSGLINEDESNELLPSALWMGVNDKINAATNILPGEFKHNISQIMVCNYLNTAGMNQLKYGNEAKLFKDDEDEVKRKLFSNASGKSLGKPYTDTNLGITRPFTEIHFAVMDDPSWTHNQIGKIGEETDGEAYCTDWGMRNLLFGAGTLTKTQAEVLDNLRDGNSITKEEWKTLLTNGGALTSFKPIAFDPWTGAGLKCSVTMLHKEDVMVNNNGKWEPDIRKKELYKVWKKLSDFEEANQTISMLIPKSASKLVNQNVAKNIDAVTDNHFQKMDSKYIRKVGETKSNKLSITDPTQVKRNVLAGQDRETELNLFGHKTTIGEVMDSYMRDSALKLTNSQNDKINEIFSLEDGLMELGKSYELNQITPKLGRLYDRLYENGMATGANEQILDFWKTRNGEPVYDGNFPALLTKFTEMVMTYLGGAMSEKVPGIAAYKVSSWGRNVIRQIHEVDEKGSPVPGKWSVVPDQNYKSNPEKYKIAKRWADNENRTFTDLVPGDYVIDCLRDNVPEFNNDSLLTGRTYHELIIPPHHSDDIGTVPKAFDQTFFTDIPYADKMNAGYGKVVDTLSAAMGSICFEPSARSVAGGKDFDIDTMYLQMKDSYENKGKTIPYGTATTTEEKFREYQIYQFNNNKHVKKLYKGDEFYSDDEYLETLLDQKSANDLNSDVNIKRLNGILKQLRLLSTVDEFIAKGGEDLNQGVLNNRILQARINLSSNKHLTEGDNPVNMELTSTDTLGDLVKPSGAFYQLVTDQLALESSTVNKDYLEHLLEMFNNPKADINSMRGISLVHSSVATGKGGVGVAANGVPVVSFLQQHPVELSSGYITLDGKDYNQLGGEHAMNGLRQFSAIMTYINTMTDNAKLRLAAKMGLSVDSLSDVMAMTATGMNLHDAQLYLLQPIARKYYKDVAAMGGVLKTSKEAMVGNKVKVLQGMINELSENGASVVPLTVKKLERNFLDNGKNKNIQLSVLMDIQKASELGNSLFKLSSVMGLVSGLPSTLEDFDKIKENLLDLGITVKNGTVEQSEQSTQFDVRDALLNKDAIMSTYIKMIAQNDHLFPLIFTEKTAAFKRFTNIIEQNFNDKLPGSLKREFTKQTKTDLLSFFSIEALIQSYKDRGMSESLSSMGLQLMYPSLLQGEQEDILQTITRLRNSDNPGYFVTNFLRSVSAVESKNNYSEVIANSWARMSDAAQTRIRDSFVQGISDPKTRKDYQAIFNYLLVKDGGQFKSGSFVSYIAPFVFKDLSDATGKVRNALSVGKQTDATSQSLFGKSWNEIKNNIVSAYGSHKDNEVYLKQVRVPGINAMNKEKIDIGDHNPIYFNPDGRIHINLFKGFDNKQSDSGIVNPVTEQETTLPEDRKTILANNLKYIKVSGFDIKRYDSGKKTADGKPIYYSQIKLPMYIKRVVKNYDEDNNSHNQVIRYRLATTDKVAKELTPEKVIGIGEDIATGVKAIYVPDEATGGRNTYRLQGANFGKVPTVSELQKVKNQKRNGEDTNQKKMVRPSYSPIQNEQVTIDKTEVPAPQHIEAAPGTVSAAIQTLAKHDVPVVNIGGKQSIPDIQEKASGFNPYSLLSDVVDEYGEDLPEEVMSSEKPVVPSQSMQQKSFVNMNLFPLNNNFTRQSVLENSKSIYLFTDNAKRTSGSNIINSNSNYVKKYGKGNYPGMTQAVIRGLDNAFPITTMVDDKRTQWDDSNFKEFKSIIDNELQTIKDAMVSGKFNSLKFAAQMPFGKGQISNMKLSAPKIWEYLNKKLKEIGIDNTGEKPKIDMQTSLFKEDKVIDWKKEIDELGKNLDNKKRELFIEDARDFYKTFHGRIPDNELLEKIKSCI